MCMEGLWGSDTHLGAGDGAADTPPHPVRPELALQGRVRTASAQYVTCRVVMGRRRSERAEAAASLLRWAEGAGPADGWRPSCAPPARGRGPGRPEAPEEAPEKLGAERRGAGGDATVRTPAPLLEETGALQGSEHGRDWWDLFSGSPPGNRLQEQGQELPDQRGDPQSESRSQQSCCGLAREGAPQ